jgi:Carboxypeptidase regulatory-like domain/TonB dependent receptor
MKLNFTKLAISLIAFIVLIAANQTINGQTITATLTGTITDSNNAVVPNARVAATNQATQNTFTAQTNTSGNYTIPFLPAGEYVVSVEATGFKKVLSSKIQLEVNQTAKMNLELSVGAVSEIVTVNDVAPVLQTENANVGTVISGNTTNNLPLNGRNFQSLTLLVPGAITPAVNSFTSLSPGAFGGRPYVNGNREQTNAFLVDGISVDETIDNRIGIKPNVDAIAEFKVETSNTSAEFGNVAGAVVNATIKSGTNNFHGNVFEFFRNDALDANLWANNRVGATKQKLRQNIYGGTFGGPIKKDKAFFFFAYQGADQRTGGGVTRSVAPLAWRNGDFSGVTTPIRDPLTGLQFPGNIVPTARFSAAARALFANPSLYPLPNRAGNVNNYVTTFATKITAHQFDIKVDLRPSDKDTLSMRYSFAVQDETGIQGALPTDLTGLRKGRPRNVVVNYTRSISSTVINEARVGINQAVFVVDAFDWAGIKNGNGTLGIAGTQAIPGLSAIRIAGLSDIGTLAVTEDNNTKTLLFADNLTFVKGNQTIKVGGQLQRYIQDRFYPGNNGLLGFFNYGTTFTGNAFGDFLLDTLSSKGVGSSTSEPWTHLQNRIGIFIQDDWKVKTNLTLNLGMRWEYSSPIVEKNNKQANFDLTTGALLLAGVNGNSRALYKPFYKAFEPRVGFAFSPSMFDGKLVLRAGYGIIQYMEGTGANLRLPLNPPFFAESDVPYDLSCATTTCNPADPARANRISTGFNGLILRNTPSGIIRAWSPNLRPQFTQQWNGTAEYQVMKDTSLTVGYVGHKATHLVAPTDWNQPLPGTGAPSTWTSAQSRRPFFSIYPLVTAIGGTDSWSRSDYHSLQASLRRRLSKGAEFLASYTYGKILTDNRGYYGSGVFAGDQGAYAANNYNRSADYGLAFFDVKHNFVLSGSYELPFGNGRTWGNNWNSAVNAILGGWNLSTIVGLKSGFPITVFDTRVTASSLQAPRAGAFPRPNRIGTGLPTAQTIDNWINAADFSSPALGTFGNSRVGILRGPNYGQIDLTIGKKFNITEGQRLDLRAEFFNFTNRPNFTLPGRDLGTAATFGRITNTINESRRVEFVVKYYF